MAGLRFCRHPFLWRYSGLFEVVQGWKGNPGFKRQPLKNAGFDFYTGLFQNFAPGHAGIVSAASISFGAGFYMTSIMTLMGVCHNVDP
jgi:hypothetical protein